MSGITPKGIRYPDGASKAKQLGPELKQMALDYEELIETEIRAENPVFRAEASSAIDQVLATRKLVEAGKDLGTQNLLDIVAVGMYLQNTAANATVARGYPVAGARGILEVIPYSAASASVVQRFTQWNRGSASGTPAPYIAVFSRIVTYSSSNENWTATEWTPQAGSLPLGTTDLGTLRTPGIYEQDSSSDATTARGYPVEGARGALEIIPFGQTYVLQRFTQWNTATDTHVAEMRTWQRALFTSASNQWTSPWVRLGGGGGGGDASVSRVVVLAAAGQSNMEGRGRPYGPDFDTPDDRILMWDWASSDLLRATVPLSSRQQQIGLSVATVVAREILKDDATARVVIVNGGVGNSGLVTGGAGPRWQLTDPASLYTEFKTAVQGAVTAASTLYGAPTQVVGLWHQGEADASATTSQSAYEAAFNALWTDFRGTYPNAPVVLGGMVPEYQAAGKAGIEAAHVNLQKSMQRTAFAPGVPNGCGAADPTDVVHYHRVGVERLGKAMRDAIPRAYANLATQQPQTPLDVTATVIGGTLTISWRPPLARVTAYSVGYRVDGGSWQTIPHATLALTATKPGLTGQVVEARVTAGNEAGSSAPSQIVRAAII